MLPQTRPRLDEFFLALLWFIGAGVWGTFGIGGYFGNLNDAGNFRLPGFVISFFLVCLTIFGLFYAVYTFLRIPARLPKWIDNYLPLLRGIVFFLSFSFSLVTALIILLHLFTEVTNTVVMGWGLAAFGIIAVLALYELLQAVSAFEPFILWQEQSGYKLGFFFRALIWLNTLQRSLNTSNRNTRWDLDELIGPLKTEVDPKTTSIEEKSGGRPALERIMTAHGGFHVTALGFTTNGSVIFALSDGAMIHYQAGGRKGTMFPPELKFWDWRNGRVQTATLGLTRVFLTHNYLPPPTLQKICFMVPSGGGRFAWVTSKLIQVGDWNSDRVQKLLLEEDLGLKGFGGFLPVTFNPDGTKLTWCYDTGEARSWDLESDRVQSLRAYPADASTVTSVTSANLAEGWGLVFSPDGTKVATLGGHGILLQNVYTGWRWFAPIDPLHEKLTAFAFSYNGLEMAAGLSRKVSPNLGATEYASTNGSLKAANGTVGRTAEVRTLKVVERPAGPPPEPPAEQPAEPLGEWQHVLRVWDLRVTDYYDLPLSDVPLREIAFSPDNRMLAAVDEAGELRLWDSPVEGFSGVTPRLVTVLDLGITGRKTVLAFSPNMEHLVSATDSRVLVWNLARLRQEASKT